MNGLTVYSQSDLPCQSCISERAQWRECGNPLGQHNTRVSLVTCNGWKPDVFPFQVILSHCLISGKYWPYHHGQFQVFEVQFRVPWYYIVLLRIGLLYWNLISYSALELAPNILYPSIWHSDPTLSYPILFDNKYWLIVLAFFHKLRPKENSQLLD